MSEPSTSRLAGTARTLAFTKVRRDLDECRQELSDWYEGPPTRTGYEETLHDACEALLRAVSELTRVVEDEPAPTFEPFDVVIGAEAAAEIASQGIDPNYEAFRADQ